MKYVTLIVIAAWACFVFSFANKEMEIRTEAVEYGYAIGFQFIGILLTVAIPAYFAGKQSS